MLFIVPIVFGPVFIILATLIYWLDFGKFKERFHERPKITVLPIMTPSGHVVSSAEDHDLHLDFLRNQLEEKERRLLSPEMK